MNIKSLAATALSASTILTGLAVTGGTARAAGCDTSWNNPAGGAWDVASNWTNGVPNANTFACLPATSAPYTALLSGNHMYVEGIYIGPGASLEVQSGYYSGGADVQVGGGGVDNEGTLWFQGSDGFFGIGGGSGTLTNNGSFILDDTYFNANVVNNSGATMEAQNSTSNRISIVNELTNNGTLRVDNAASLYVDNLLSIDSTGQLGGGNYIVSGSLVLSNPNLVQRVFTNNANLDLDGAGRFIDNYGNNVLGLLGANAAEGILALTNGASLSLVRSGFTNNDYVLITDSSTLTAPGYVQAAGSTNLESGGTIVGSVNVSGGLLSGGGTIHGSVRNSAIVELSDSDAALLTVTGAYTQTSAGRLDTYVSSSSVRCGGRVQTAGCLAVHGRLRLAGTLGINVWTNAVPAAGSHSLLATTWKSETGKFAHVIQVTGPLPGNLGLIPTSYGKHVILTVEPLA